MNPPDLRSRFQTLQKTFGVVAAVDVLNNDRHPLSEVARSDCSRPDVFKLAPPLYDTEVSVHLIPFTAAEYKKMQDRLKFLTALRLEVVERLKVAREMGDLSENGAYRYAKFELGNIGRESRRLTHLLENGHVVESKHDGTIGFGSTVTLQQGEVVTKYLLVSKHESDPAHNKLSLESPLGQAVLAKKVGESFVVSTPRGEVLYTLIAVE